MEQEKAELEKSIEHKKTDDYVEERARGDLNLVKPGEKVFVVVGGKSTKDTGITTQKSTKSPIEAKKQTIDDNNLYKWYRLFF